MVGLLNGKKVVITGAGAGIGRASALLFAKEGAQVVSTDLDLTKVQELLGTEGIINAIKVDILKKEDVENLVKQVGRVDVLFNCAGWVPGGTILDTPDSTWDLAMNLNVKGAFWMCQGFIPLSLKEKKPMAIVNMASAASSIKGVVNRCAYSTSKGALIALTKSIAADYVGEGVRANNICPGTVDTPSWRDRVSQSDDPLKAKADFIARQKMGRLGTAEEIAALALYLASDEAAYVTGQEFIIDGGWCL